MQEIPYKICLFRIPLVLDTCFIFVLVFMPISLFIINSIELIMKSEMGIKTNTDIENIIQ